MKRLLLCTALWVLLVGCASPPSGNWNQRIANYTYTQAVKDMGKPLKSDKFRDGTIMVKWLIRGRQPTAVAFGMDGVFGTPGMVIYQVPAASRSMPNRYLGLMFGPDGKLVSWDRFYE